MRTPMLQNPDRVAEHVEHVAVEIQNRPHFLTKPSPGQQGGEVINHIAEVGGVQAAREGNSARALADKHAEQNDHYTGTQDRQEPHAYKA